MLDYMQDEDFILRLCDYLANAMELPDSGVANFVAATTDESDEQLTAFISYLFEAFWAIEAKERFDMTSTDALVHWVLKTYQDWRKKTCD